MRGNVLQRFIDLGFVVGMVQAEEHLAISRRGGGREQRWQRLCEHVGASRKPVWEIALIDIQFQPDDMQPGFGWRSKRLNGIANLKMVAVGKRLIDNNSAGVTG